MSKFTFHPSILREYDIRGIVGETLFEKDAYWIGRAFGHVVRENQGKAVAVGRDGRLSSPSLHASLMQGLCEAGVDVYDIGVGPTPMLYFAEYTLPIDAAIMITGSHNPPSHNGFKMSLNKKPFFGEAIQHFSHLLSQPLCEGKGTITKSDLQPSYISRLLHDFHCGRELTIAWDPGNGSTCELLKTLLQGIPGKYIVLNGEIDGTFPAHPPDPSNPSNLRDLQQAVLENKCDLGIAFDGDGDRLAAVDNKGRIICGDQLLLIFASHLLKRNSDVTIIADVKTSQAVFDEIKRLNGNALMWKTGHSHIKEKMRESGAILAGEMSGHFFFKENYYGFDDGIYAALRLIQLITESNQTLSDVYDQLPQLFSTPEIRISCPSARKFQIPHVIKENLKTSAYRVNDIDGIRVELPDGWWLLRASNTQDVLVARCESSSEKGLGTLINHLKDALAKEQISLTFDE